MAVPAAPVAASTRWSRTLAQTAFACGASLLLHVLALGGLAWLYRSSGPSAPATLDLRIASVYLAPAASVPGEPGAVPLPVAAPARPARPASERVPVRDLSGVAPIPRVLALADPEIAAPASVSLPAAPMTAPATRTPSATPMPDAGMAVEWRVQDWLAQHRQYPRSARRSGAEGTVWVRFVLDRAGALHGSEVLESSGHAVLDRAALELLQRAAPFPALPATLTLDEIELVLPIEYDLTRAGRG